MDLSVHPEQLLIMFVVFMASAMALNYLVFKPTLAILNERIKRLAGLSKEAKSLDLAHEQRIAVYTKLMDEAKQAARAARESILKTAETEQKRIVNEARQNSETVIKNAKRSIALETSEARLKLRQSSQELSRSMIEKILKRKVA